MGIRVSICGAELGRVSGGFLRRYAVVSRTRATGSTPRSGGEQVNPTATPFSDRPPTKAMALSLSSLSLLQDLLVTLLSLSCLFLSLHLSVCCEMIQSELYWPATERWLRQRYAEAFPGEEEDKARFYVLGYQWRSLRFNDETRQSTVKVMAASRASEPGSVFLMQQPHCLAVPCKSLSISLSLKKNCKNCELVSSIFSCLHCPLLIII